MSLQKLKSLQEPIDKKSAKGWRPKNLKIEIEGVVSDHVKVIRAGIFGPSEFNIANQKRRGEIFLVFCAITYLPLFFTSLLILYGW